MVVGGIGCIKTEIQYADGVDAFQSVIPFTTWRLLADGERGVIDAAVLEELLFAFLHLYQEIFTPFVLTIYVKYCTAVIDLCTQTFRIQVGDLRDLNAKSV